MSFRPERSGVEESLSNCLLEAGNRQLAPGACVPSFLQGEKKGDGEAVSR